MNGLEIAIGAVIGVILTEFTEISPWLARRLVGWAACRWADDPEVASEYAEEWAAVIEERPGKLFKLFTAIAFTSGAMYRQGRRGAQRRVQRIGELWTAVPVHMQSQVKISGVWIIVMPVMTAGFISSEESDWFVIFMTIVSGVAVVISIFQIITTLAQAWKRIK